MKLSGKSVFDKAVIVYVRDIKLSFEDAYRCALNFNYYGIILDEDIGIDGEVLLWVEDDDWYPIIHDVYDNLVTVWDEFKLDEYIGCGLISQEDSKRILQLRDMINEKYLMKHYEENMEDGV